MSRRKRRPFYIPVEINGIQHLTILGKDGVQRFQRHPQIAQLVDANIIDLNALAVATKVSRTVSIDTRRWVYMQMGYSLTGYQDIFPQDTIKNPLWD